MESRNGGKVRYDVLTRHQDMGTSLPRCSYGIFNVGRACFHALQTILLGPFIPVVKAASKEEPPQRPPKMKYQDLPIYASPHNDYKEYLLKKNSCPGANIRILHRALLPWVKKLRENSRDIYCDICCGFRGTYKDMRQSIVSAKNEFKKTMRDPANLQMRQGVLAAGTMLGFLMGGGGGIPRRAIYTSLGALAAGSLCFPKETDEAFREATYHAAKASLAFYNGMCRKNYQLRERVPCKDGLPAEPKPKKPVCPQKK